MRSYTISSSPSVPYSFSITVKLDTNGLVSNWLHTNLNEGDQLAVHGPVGLFNCIDFPARKVLLLSGGVGITPVMSMARWWFDTNADVDISFVHSARTPKDIVFQRELDHMASRISNFSLHLICEKIESGQAWHGSRGYLDQIKNAFLITERAFKETARSKMRDVLFELDPDRIIAKGGGMKFGPLRKAEQFETYREKFYTCKKWFDSGRFMGDFLREFEKNCQQATVE